MRVLFLTCRHPFPPCPPMALPWCVHTRERGSSLVSPFIRSLIQGDQVPTPGPHLTFITSYGPYLQSHCGVGLRHRNFEGHIESLMPSKSRDPFSCTAVGPVLASSLVIGPQWVLMEPTRPVLASYTHSSSSKQSRRCVLRCLRGLVGTREKGWHEAEDSPVGYLPCGGEARHLPWRLSLSLAGWKCTRAFGARKTIGVATILKRHRIHRKGGVSVW